MEFFLFINGFNRFALLVKAIAIACIISLLPFTAPAQDKPVSCAELRNGIFYFYPKNSKDKYIDIRDDIYLHETNITSGDTSLWQIKWTSDCRYSLTYISGSEKITPRAAKFMNKHNIVYEISKPTDEYYLFKSFLDKTTNLPMQDDTMWLHEKTVVTNNELFTQVADSLVFAPSPVSDTSKYALLYLYRPGKLLLCLADYLLYFDNNILWTARNNSGAMFRILKEGTYDLGSRLYKGKSVVPLTIQFGHVYYVKTTIDWGVHQNLYNFKLNNEVVTEEEGRREFDKVKLR